MVTYLSYDRFENLISNGDIEEISDAEFDTLKEIVEYNLTSFVDDDSLSIKCKKVNRFHFDNVESAMMFNTYYLGPKGRKRVLIEDIIFYKFVDEWWLVEITFSDSRRHTKSWMLDSFDGIKEWVDVNLREIVFVS